MEQIWSSAVFFRDVNGDGAGFDNNITQADINALRDAVLAKCDVLDNDRIRDNVVGNPQACAAVFTDADVEALGAARGLTPGQVQAIKDVYRGPHNSAGTRWHKGKPLGTEFSWGAFVVPTPANNNFPAQGGFSMELANFIWFEHDPGVPTARRTDPSLLPGPGEWRWLDFDFDRNTPTGTSPIIWDSIASTSTGKSVPKRRCPCSRKSRRRCFANRRSRAPARGSQPYSQAKARPRR